MFAYTQIYLKELFAVEKHYCKRQGIPQTVFNGDLPHK